MRAVNQIAAAILGVVVVSCGSGTKAPQTETTKQAETPKPLNESHRFPKANLIGTDVQDKELMGKAFMPGGTVGRYRKGALEYELFVARLRSPTDAAVLLLDWKKALTDAKLVPSFGGYFGQDAGRPVFVFSKGSWIAGVAGLPEKQADAQARLLAAELD
jgi:hypothetical protein